MDPAVNLLIDIYNQNRESASSERLGAFVKSLHGLGLGFTKLQVMKIASSCKLDDWDVRYEEELKQSMDAMPGSYPGAHIEEVS